MSPNFAGARQYSAPITDEPVLTENATKVLEARYLKKNEAGECLETPRDLFRRVARTIADVETLYGASEAERSHWEDRFYRLMTSGAYMPNSPTLMNAGREMGMLSACFVLPVRDSIVEIFNSIKHTAMIQKAGGGTGFAFDELRPTGDFIRSSGGTTSGPITFWRAFSEATNAIQQGAFRRGANMGMMYIHHPDILKFLHAKQDLNQFTNYNISVKITNEWMTEFLGDVDSPHVVRNPRNGQCFVIPRDLDIWKGDIRNFIPVECVVPVSPTSPERYHRSPRLTGMIPEEWRGKVYTKRDIWNIIVKNAWQTGEPGVVFIDRINEHNPTPHVGRIEATNPCGEQPLLPYEACNLGSVNLGLFVQNPCTPQARVDWDALRDAVHLSTRFLDNVIDANNYPLDEIDAICKANRKIGLGVMGFADALYKLNVPYNSDEGVQWGERFMKFVNDEAHNYSEYLAKSRGAFPNWRGSIWQTRHNRLMRNSAVTTVAPTGTISIIANCSGGIEPMFSLAFIRNVLRGQKQGEKPLVETNETFLAVAKARGFYSEELMERVAREGTLAHIEGIPADIARVFVCAHDIAPEWHMKMQAAFQRHCDASISKTINFPHAASVSDVETIYRLAWDLNCKGVTVYRDGCRSFQPMALKKEDSGKKESAAATESAGETSVDEPAADAGAVVADTDSHQPVRAPGTDLNEGGFPTVAVSNGTHTNGSANGHGYVNGHPASDTGRAHVAVATNVRGEELRIEPTDLPEIVSGLRIRQMTPFGNMHVKITVDPRMQRELEIFAQLGKGGDVANSDLEGMCRVGSLWLRAGGTLKHLIKQWEGIGSSLQIPTRAGRIMSLPDGLACALKKYLRAKERFGLRALLLGEVDLASLDAPSPQVAAAVQLDRPATLSDLASVTAAEPFRAAEPGRDRRGAPHPAGEEPSRERKSSGNPLEVPPGGGPVTLSGMGTGRSASVSSPTLTTAAERLNRLAGDAAELTQSLIGYAAVESARSQHPAGSGEATILRETAAAVMPIPALEERLSVDFADLGVERVTETTTLSASITETTLSDDLLMEVETHMHMESRHSHDAAVGYKVKCPQCDGVLAFQEGCKKCYACGFSAC